MKKQNHEFKLKSIKKLKIFFDQNNEKSLNKNIPLLCFYLIEGLDWLKFSMKCTLYLGRAHSQLCLACKPALSLSLSLTVQSMLSAYQKLELCTVRHK